MFDALFLCLEINFITLLYLFTGSMLVKGMLQYRVDMINILSILIVKGLDISVA